MYKKNLKKVKEFDGIEHIAHEYSVRHRRSARYPLRPWYWYHYNGKHFHLEKLHNL